MSECPHELEFAQKLAEVDSRSKSNTHRLDDLEKRQDGLDKIVTSVEVLATKQSAMESDVKEIKSDVKALTAKPGKRWDAVAEKVVMLLVAAVMAYLLAKVGL